MKSINKKYFMQAIAILALAACQTMPYQPYARDVKRKPNQSGVIALKTEHQEEDRQKAMAMMNSNCQPLPAKIVEEGEVAVGQESTSNSNTSKTDGHSSQQVGNFFGIPVMSTGSKPTESTNSTISTKTIKEWQINYECVANTSLQKKTTVK